MSAENVEVVRGGYQRFRTTGQLDAEIATPDFVWDMSNFHGWPEQQIYEGVEGAETFLRDWTSTWDDWELELEGLRDAGDKVLALLRQRGRSKGAGTPVDMYLAQVLRHGCERVGEDRRDCWDGRRALVRAPARLTLASPGQGALSRVGVRRPAEGQAYGLPGHRP
jgi:hypothetical protein